MAETYIICREFFQFFIKEKVNNYNLSRIIMLFQSDYWLASNYAERLETIRNFIDTDEGIKTLVVIDKTLNCAKEVMNNINEELECNIKLISEVEEILYENLDSSHIKRIYIFKTIEDALSLMKITQPILAIFL